MKTKKLVTTSMLIAIAAILSLIIIFALPFGGSITAASMVPIVLIGYLYGVRWGVFGAFAYSLIQMLVGMGTISAFFLPGDSQMSIPAAVTICFIDYIAAYSCLGLAGIFGKKFKNKTWAIICGSIMVCIIRYLFHTISGAIFFGTWAEWFFADSTGLSQITVLKGFCDWVMNNFSGHGLSVVYSLIYNGSYMIPETVITVIVTPILYKALNKVVE